MKLPPTAVSALLAAGVMISGGGGGGAMAMQPATGDLPSIGDLDLSDISSLSLIAADTDSSSLASFKLHRLEDIEEMRSRGIFVDDGNAQAESDSVHDEKASDKKKMNTRSSTAGSKNKRNVPPRRLTSTVEGDFVPLACNSPSTPHSSCAEGGTPLPFSSLLDISTDNTATATASDIIIPCGQCYAVDPCPRDDPTATTGCTPPEITITGGIDIQGRLTVPEGAGLTLNTEYVYLQGELDIQSDAEITESNMALRVVLTGSTEQTFHPTDSNTGKCGTEGCSVGIKPFIVAGGKFNIDAMAETCPSWTHLKSFTAQGGVTLSDEQKLARYHAPPAGCTTALVDNAFEITGSGAGGGAGASGTEAGTEGWDGDKGASVELDVEGRMTIMDRRAAWQGPTNDVTYLRDCLESDVDYLFTAKVMLLPPPGVEERSPTTCAETGNSCLRFKTLIREADDSTHDVSMNWEYKSTAPRYNEWHDFSATVNFDGEWNIDTAKYIVLKFSGPEDGVEMVIDRAKLALPEPESFVSTCSDMIPNGNQNGNGPSPYPMRVNQDRYPPIPQTDGNARLISQEEIVGDGNETNIYSTLVGRHYDWHGPSYREIPPVCIQPHSVYRMSMKVRLHSPPESEGGPGKFEYYADLRAHYTETGEDGITKYHHYATRRLATCDPIDFSDGWVTCTKDLVIYDHSDPNAEQGRKFTEADWYKWEMKTSRKNVDGQWVYSKHDIDYDDIKFELLHGGVDGLIVPIESVQGCWGPGSEIAITSHTLRYEDSQVATITNVTPGPISGTSKIIIDGGIIPATTMQDAEANADGTVFAAEVALLSRNVEIQSDNGYDSDQGGYVQVMHTPGVEQKIGGVEFKFMGQDKTADRFPLHFHMNRNSGSVVQKNTVRNSYSRGVVIEGTDNTTISENVAYNTRGNVFTLVDGSETENLFYKNLAALGYGTMNRVDASNQDDRYPASFYTRTPKNRWVGNVAAGNRRAGFTFHLDWDVRYESSSIKGRPRNFGLLQFEDNVAHSNYDYGIDLRDFEPSSGKTFSGEFYNTNVYKNRYKGWRIEYNRDILIDGGTLADNHIGIYNYRSNDITLRNLKVRGETEEFKRVAAIQGAERFCHNPWDSLKDKTPIGIYWMTYNRYENEGRNKMDSLDIAGFDDGSSPGCTSGTGLYIRSQNSGSISEGGSPHFAYKTSITDVTISDNDNAIMNACYGEEKLGVDDILMDIEDGFGFNGVAGPSVIVSNTDKMLNMVQFAYPGTTCTPYPESCVAVCAQTCLRQVEFAVEKEASKNMKMVVTNDIDGNTLDVDGMIYLGSNQVHRDRSRYFYAALPEGNFTISFVDKDTGATGWPKYVIERWESAPTCTSHANPGDVTINEGPDPEEGWDAYCSELIRNGDLESGPAEAPMEPWNYNGNGELELVAGGGVGASTAIQLRSRSRDWGGLGMFLDQRCVKRSLGVQFEIKAQLRLFNKNTGEPMDCNPNHSSMNSGCPEIIFKKNYRKDQYKADMTRVDRTEWGFPQYPAAEVVRNYNANEFNLIHGLYTMTTHHLDSESMFISIRNVHPDANIVIDELSMKPFGAFDIGSANANTCDDLATNGGLELGNACYWDTFGSEKDCMLVEGADGPEDLAIKMIGRTRTYDSPRQDLKINCMEAGARYVAEVKFKLEDTNGNVVACTPQLEDSAHYTPEQRAIKCPEIKEYHEGPGFGSYLTLAHASVPTFTEGWSVAKGTFYANEDQAKAHRIRVWLEDEPIEYSITMDDLHVRPIPMEEACGNLVLNPNFEKDLSFWRSITRKNAAIDRFYGDGTVKIDPIPGGGAILHSRSNYYAGMAQRIEHRCFTVGETFVVHGSFKLQNATGHGAICDDGSEDLSNCPTIEIKFEGCDSGSWIRTMTNDIQEQWKPDEYNAFLYQELPIDAEIASCDKAELRIRNIDEELDILVQSVSIVPKTAMPTTAPTLPVTPSPTSKPTAAPVAPTASPTARPTDVAIALPLVGESVLIGDGSQTVALTKTEPGVMATLAKVTLDANGEESTVIPFARSYDANDWEPAPGRIVEEAMYGQEWLCHETACELDLPTLGPNEQYQLSSSGASARYSASATGNIAARFLEMSTFGPTQGDINGITAASSNRRLSVEDNIHSWIVGQMDETKSPATSHREYWRARANPRWTFPEEVGRAGKPCKAGSRWRKYAFTNKDRFDEDFPRYLTIAPTSEYCHSHEDHGDDTTFHASCVGVHDGASCSTTDNSVCIAEACVNICVPATAPADGTVYVGLGHEEEQPTGHYYDFTGDATPSNLIPGNTYTFTRSAGTHPFAIKGCPNLVATGNGDSFTYTIPVLPPHTPSLAKFTEYVCTAHDWMTAPLVPKEMEMDHHVLIYDGFPRTVVSSFDIPADSPYLPVNSTLQYQIDNSPHATSKLEVRLEGAMGDEVLLNKNPDVDFTGYECAAGQVLTLPGSFTFVDNGEIDLMLDADINDELCTALPDVVDEGDPPIFGQMSDGSWWVYDPRLILESNTVDAPLADGGGSASLETAQTTLCSNVPRTFLNEETCYLSTESSTCTVGKSIDAAIELNDENIVQIHQLTGRYTYAIEGLVVVDNYGNETDHFCTPNYRSRWLKEANQVCEGATSLGTDTNATITSLILQNADDPNPFMRDVVFPSDGSLPCDHDSPLGTKIQVGSDCWTHVHQDYLGVYDMTYWTLPDTHPGNMVAAMEDPPDYNPIKKWLDINNSPHLVFPSSHPETDLTANPPFNLDHPILRWEIHNTKFDYVGRFGDTIFFKDLPTGLRTTEVAAHYGATLNTDGANVLVCGSPGEIANDPEAGSLFDVTANEMRDTTSSGSFAAQRENVWSTIVVEAQDQLRQRMAWALNQILVIVKDGIASQDRNTEMFLQYYDIMVRHAFGNYGDILKEISYSPLMAEHLTYLRSTSTAYEWQENRIVVFADENYAREVMQLFTIGLVRLNMDGSPVHDEDGNKVATYTNEHILNYAKAWTGFDHQLPRGNIEDYMSDGNKLDPMRIVPEWRDRFPKSDLDEGYVGDGYPLCTDMPPGMFLNEGATFRLLGGSSLPELVEDPVEFETEANITKFVLAENSGLKAVLACRDKEGTCQYFNKVVLPSSITCTNGSASARGDECDVDTVRTVQVADGIFYEYVPPPCVNQAFFNDAVKLGGKTSWDGWLGTTCADPRLAVAGEACCNAGMGSKVAQRMTAYDGERMTFAKAQQRCESLGDGWENCFKFDTIDEDDFKTAYHWDWDGEVRAIPSCTIRAKVDAKGNAGLVYVTSGAVVEYVDLDSRSNFPVYWEGGEFPSPDNNCGNGLCTPKSALQAGGAAACECDATVEDSQAFTTMPSSKEEIMSTLKIGAMNPASYGANVYTSRDVNGFKIHEKNGFNKDAIFEVVDAKKSRTLYYKNTVSMVQIGSYSFRNPPHFLSMVPSETNLGDAQDETDAVLASYFYQDTTAPFLAIRMIKRFGISNPSPRYIETVATAFSTGLYRSGDIDFGEGKYGDLKATAAAILLDREARNILVDNDPSYGSLREPLIKVVGLMRSMAYTSNQNYPLIELHNMDRRIGEMAHEYPSVFSFFLPEYEPDGRIASAGLAAPEAQLMDMPKIVDLQNGLYSLVKNGLRRDSINSYNYGFAPWTQQLGFLSYDPASTDNVDAVIDSLARLLTAGRLSDKNRDIIKATYEESLSTDGAQAALKLAQQYVISTPEYHSTQTPHFSGAPRTKEAEIQGRSDNVSYKAVVYIMLTGGADSYSFLAPYDCSAPDNTTLSTREQYDTIRHEVALDKDVDLDMIPAGGPDIVTGRDQPCESFGVHKSFPIMRDLYLDESALWFANTGVLTKPVTKDNYRDVSAITQLFAHNTQQDNARRIDPFELERGTGVLGRMADALHGSDYKTSGVSIRDATVTLAGKPGYSPQYRIVNTNAGSTEFNPQASAPDMQEKIFDLNNATTSDSGFFAETWATKSIDAIELNEQMARDLDPDSPSNQLDTPFDCGDLCNKLKVVAKLIKSANANPGPDSEGERHVQREFFYMTTGGWDMHSMVIPNLQHRLEHVNAAITQFVAEMKAQGKYDQVTVIETSDFARTLDPNGNAGVDHGWGGNYFMLGGDVKGGQIVNRYPDDILNPDGSEGASNVGRGRMIPSMPWDSVWHAIADWMGVEEADMDKVLPNKGNFPPDSFLTAADLFRNGAPAQQPVQRKRKALRK